MVFPELFRCILSSHALKNLFAAFFFSLLELVRHDKKREDRHTRMIVLELCQVIDIAINDNVQVRSLVMRRNVGSSKHLGHGGLGSGVVCVYVCRNEEK